jgi:hypothetical protein
MDSAGLADQRTDSQSSSSARIAGYHLYYPSRRQPSPAFSLVVQVLRISSTKGD